MCPREPKDTYYPGGLHTLISAELMVGQGVMEAGEASSPVIDSPAGSGCHLLE